MADSHGNPSIKSRNAVLKVTDAKVIKHPSDVSVIEIESESVELECAFNVPTNCVWYRNGLTADIYGRYKYKNRARSELTSDCSIIISPIAMNDAGRWKCGNKAVTESPSIASNTILITVEALKIIRSPKSLINVYNGSNVFLSCEFNTNVNCSWVKNRVEMNVDGYYVDQSKRGNNTRLCSIFLSNVVREIHEGNWTCSNQANDKISVSLQSQVAYIAVKDKEDCSCNGTVRDSTVSLTSTVSTHGLNVNATAITPTKFLMNENPIKEESESVSTASSTGYIVAITVLLLIVMALIGFLVYKFREKIIGWANYIFNSHSRRNNAIKNRNKNGASSDNKKEKKHLRGQV
ncbi:hypothetical protein CHUAL_006282 [Chamberlinius hualienensis]